MSAKMAIATKYSNGLIFAWNPSPAPLERSATAGRRVETAMLAVAVVWVVVKTMVPFWVLL